MEVAAQPSILTRAWDGISHAFYTMNEVCDTNRERFVHFITQPLPEQYARIVDRISQTVPEVIAGVCYITGAMTIPAFFLSWARKVYPLLPVARCILNPEIDTNELAEKIKQSLQNLEQLFDRVIVPALFICLVADTVFSFAVGWLTQDWQRLLHGTVVALPGAFLAFKYMWDQVSREIKDEEVTPDHVSESESDHASIDADPDSIEV